MRFYSLKYYFPLPSVPNCPMVKLPLPLLLLFLVDFLPAAFIEESLAADEKKIEAEIGGFGRSARFERERECVRERK